MQIVTKVMSNSIPSETKRFLIFLKLQDAGAGDIKYRFSSLRRY